MIVRGGETVERLCESCGRPIEHLRAGARHCDSPCRSEASRKRQGLSAREIAPKAERFWRAYRSVRAAHKRANRRSERVSA